MTDWHYIASEMAADWEAVANQSKDWEGSHEARVALYDLADYWKGRMRTGEIEDQQRQEARQ